MVYKDDEQLDLSAMLNGLTSSNVNTYPWRTEQERQRVYEGILLIERYIDVPQEERAEFELYKLLNSMRAIADLIYGDHFIEVLMARNKEVRREDLAGIGLNEESVSKVERHLLSNKDFKRWCDRYALPPAVNHNGSHQNGPPPPPPPIVPVQVTSDTFE
jgi:hypothetical protein